MATRQELQKRIAELDAQINAELSRTKLPDLNARRRVFPVADWIVAALLLGYDRLGSSLPFIGEFHDDVHPWDLYLGLFVAAIAALRTIGWVLKGRVKSDANYMDATGKVRDLQAQRRDLQARMKDAD